MSRGQAKGFVLVELLVVVAVIGILAAVAIPAYEQYTLRARVAEAFTLAQPVQARIAEYHVHRGRFPADNRTAGILPPEDIKGSQVVALEVAGGAIHLRFAEGLHEPLAGKVLSLRPAVRRDHPTGPLVWLCAGAGADGFEPAGEDRTDIDDRYRVGVCR